MSDRKRILLHLCCGPCGTETVRRLSAQGDVTLFFSNSNIYPLEEFTKRRFEAERLAAITGCPLVVDIYDHDAWTLAIDGAQTEPEGGARCIRCFEFSLRRSADYADTHGFDGMTTSLTVSRFKDSKVIMDIGRRTSGRFLEIDFKKKDGFRKSVELSREYGMYRQTYCGCEFSIR